MANDALDTTVADLAANPLKVETDGLLVMEHPIPDVITADKYLQAKNAAVNKGRGLRFTKLIPPGPIGTSTDT